MDPTTKTWVSLGLVVLAVFEFLAAMRLFGVKGNPTKKARLLLRLHRIFGYVFLLYFIWISAICVDLMDRLAEVGVQMDARAVIHASLALIVFAVLAVKISFIRWYRNYRPYVPMLGIMASSGTVVLWGIAGWMYLIIV